MPYHMYLSISGENKISIYTTDTDTGHLLFQEEVALGGSPGPLAVDPGQRYLYAGLRSTREIVSFRLDPHTGKISPFATVSLDADPCYMATDHTGRFLLSACYSAGKAAVHPIDEDGAVHGPPIEWRDTARCAHCIQTDASNRYVFVPHVAESNAIHQFLFDERTGKLTPSAKPVVAAPAGTGPRHYCFHPALDVVYVDNEQGSSVTAYHFDGSNGTLEAFQTLSTLPGDFDGENTCAQIHMDPAGHFVYVSNRGHDSIACFAADPSTGALRTIGCQPTEPTPRAFNLDPDGHFLYAAGQASGNLAAYRIDPQSGALTPLETYAVGQSPLWVMVLSLG